jgi:flagellar biosynthetic protein FliQ
MNTTQVVGLATETLWAAALVAGPFLIAVLIVGLTVGLFQSVTQLNEPTLTFIPKFVAVGAVIWIFGPWMLATMLTLAHELLDRLPGLIGLG